MAYRGKFTCKNPAKYKGDHKKITYRSMWENRLMHYCDQTEAVVAWNSEEVVIPYICPTDGKRHRYFMDFWVKLKKPDGTFEEKLIEVKPHAQKLKPKPKQGKAKWRYQKEVFTWLKNQAKWKAAEQWAAKRGMLFEVFTEYELGLKKRPGKK